MHSSCSKLEEIFLAVKIRPRRQGAYVVCRAGLGVVAEKTVTLARFQSSVVLLVFVNFYSEQIHFSA